MKKYEILKLLMSYSEYHDLCKGLSKESIINFEKNNSIILPQELKELYECFDGGEIFIPGTLIYGLLPSEKRKNLREANLKKTRCDFNLPNKYLIFAKLNFGDMICVNINSPFDVIQWDHESDEQFCYWNSIYEWLEETIKDFQEYEAGNN